MRFKYLHRSIAFNKRDLRAKKLTKHSINSIEENKQTKIDFYI